MNEQYLSEVFSRLDSGATIFICVILFLCAVVGSFKNDGGDK